MKNNSYQRITDKDIAALWNTPAVGDAPAIDIFSVIREKLKDAPAITYICFVYKWGVIQGQRMERAKRKGGRHIETK